MIVARRWIGWLSLSLFLGAALMPSVYLTSLVGLALLSLALYVPYLMQRTLTTARQCFGSREGESPDRATR